METKRTAKRRKTHLIEFCCLPPTSDIADRMIAGALDRCPELKTALIQRGGDLTCILSEDFGITPDVYENGIVAYSGAGADTIADDPFTTCYKGKCGTFTFVPSMVGASVFAIGNTLPPLATPLVLTPTDLASVYASDAPRTTYDLHPDIFSAIVDGLVETAEIRKAHGRPCEPSVITEAWIAEEGCPAWFSLISPRTSEIINITTAISDVLFLPFRDLLERGGLFKDEFCSQFHISRRTVEDWISDRQPCRTFIRLMAAEAMGIIRRRHQ